MKGIVKNITDVITNSSSEVFVMNESSANYYANLENTNGCITINEITWSWIEKQGRFECEMIAYICDLDLEELQSESFWKQDKDRFYMSEWWGTPRQEDWNIFIDIHHDIIENKLIGKYMVDIEDHFEDAYDVTDSARSDSEWSESRH